MAAWNDPQLDPGARPVPPIIVAHRDMSEGSPVRWGRWYLHGIYESGELDSSYVENADQYVAYDALGRRLDLSRMPEGMDVIADEGDAVDLEILLRRHLRESDGAGAEDRSLGLEELIAAVGPTPDPGRAARALFSIVFVCLVLLPWMAGIGLAIWVVTELV